MRNLELQGHWASDKPYTLYSLRSSFVDDKLMQDTPIAVLSMMTGHDPKILMKHYSRIDELRKSKDLTKLPIGRKKDVKKLSSFSMRAESSVIAKSTQNRLQGTQSNLKNNPLFILANTYSTGI